MILSEAQFEPLTDASHLFVKRDTDGKISIIIDKITDYLLMVAAIPGMEHLSKTLSKRFRAIKVIIDEEFTVNRCVIN